jgi:uncharacterized membrane protein YedE/YeeE
MASPAAARVDSAEHTRPTSPGVAPYFGVGALFGVVLVKAEVVSWFRIQEMFRFQAVHMYGIILSAVVVAGLSLAALRRRRAHALDGSAIGLAPKTMGRGYRYWIGGSLFGLGWALTGACPGPLFALLGSGVTAIAPVILAALAGTWAYGALRPRLPH